VKFAIVISVAVVSMVVISLMLGVAVTVSTCWNCHNSATISPGS
jgi:hypothetical protein